MSEKGTKWKGCVRRFLSLHNSDLSSSTFHWALNKFLIPVLNLIKKVLNLFKKEVKYKIYAKKVLERDFKIPGFAAVKRRAFKKNIKYPAKGKKLWETSLSGFCIYHVIPRCIATSFPLSRCRTSWSLLLHHPLVPSSSPSSFSLTHLTDLSLYISIFPSYSVRVSGLSHHFCKCAFSSQP